MLKAQSSWDASPAAVSHLCSVLCHPSGVQQWGTHHCPHHCLLGDSGVSLCTPPRPGGDGKPQPRALAQGLVGLVQRLLGWIRGLLGSSSLTRQWLWVSLGWFWWKSFTSASAACSVPSQRASALEGYHQPQHPLTVPHSHPSRYSRGRKWVKKENNKSEPIWAGLDDFCHS